MSAAQFHNTLAMLVQTYGDLLLAEKLRGDAEKARADKAEDRIRAWEADTTAKVPFTR